MKKYVAMVSAFVVTLAATACSNNTDVLSQIIEVRSSDSLASSESNSFNHINQISKEPVITQELPAGETKHIQLEGKVYELTYSETLYNPVLDIKTHEYSVNGYDAGVIRLREDGTIVEILGIVFDTVDIEKTDSAETVRAAMEAAIPDLIDFSKYEFVEAKRFLAGNDDDFKSYTFCYSNKYQGYYTEFVALYVNSNGEIFKLFLPQYEIDVSDIGNIDKELENDLIVKKLKSIYDTKNTEYRSHRLDDYLRPSLVINKGELHVQHMAYCYVYDYEQERESCYITTLLIPVRFLTAD